MLNWLHFPTNRVGTYEAGAKTPASKHGKDLKVLVSTNEMTTCLTPRHLFVRGLCNSFVEVFLQVKKLQKFSVPAGPLPCPPGQLSMVSSVFCRFLQVSSMTT